MSTLAHTTLNVQQVLTKNSMTPIPRPPYSPDLALSDFYFHQIKEVLRRQHFTHVEEAKQKITELEGIKTDKFKKTVLSN